MSKVLVQYVGRYDFLDKDGKQVKGAKVTFVDPRIPVSRPDSQKGIPLVELGIPFENFGDFDKVPGVYDIETANIPASGGKLRVIYTGSKFIKEYKYNLD